MRTFIDKQQEKVGKNRLHVVYKNVDTLQAMFADKSYALVSYPAGSIMDQGVVGFVPIVPRHMSAANWRNLFWLDPQLVVIHGRRFPSLCSGCDRALGCMGKGKDVRYGFECEVTSESLMEKMTIRKKGEPSCPR